MECGTTGCIAARPAFRSLLCTALWLSHDSPRGLPMELNAGTYGDKRLQVPGGSVDHGSLAGCKRAREAMPLREPASAPFTARRRNAKDAQPI